MPYNTINWAGTIGTTVELSDNEYRVLSAYRNMAKAIRRSLSAISRVFDVIRQLIMDWYFKQRYGERVTALGYKTPSYELYLNRNGKVGVRGYSGVTGSYKVLNGKSVKVSHDNELSIWAESNIERCRKIAQELIENDTEKKIDKRVEKTRNWEMAVSKRNYGFNQQWTTGLDHERGMS